VADTTGRGGPDRHGPERARDEEHDPDPPSIGADAASRGGLSRRTFLAVGSTIAAASVLPGCTPGRDRGATPAAGPSAAPQPGVRVPENREVVGGTLGRFLDPQQIALVTAMAARIIPGDEDDPGAVDAGSVEYIDRLLATHEGYPERTYTSGPFAVAYEGDEEPEPEEGVIWVQEDELERYGWQSGLPPREIYRMGLARLDALA
jgi:gluconate 2-dehydrogenase gamma chain